MARPDEERLDVFQKLLSAHATVLAKLEKELEEARGLPLTQYEVLLHLNGAGGELRMQELAKQVLLSKSGLTRLIDRMEDAGLIERRACPSDGRGTNAVLTPQGKAALRRAAPVHLRGIEEHFTRHLTDDEVATMRTALGRVISGG